MPAGRGDVNDNERKRRGSQGAREEPGAVGPRKGLGFTESEAGSPCGVLGGRMMRCA